MLSKSLIQFSVDGWGCVPFILLNLRQTMVEIVKTMATFFKRSHGCTAELSATDPAPGHRQPTPPLETPGHSQASLGQSPVGSLLLCPSPGAHRFCFCLQRSVFSVLWKCRLYGGVYGAPLQSAHATPGFAAPRALPLWQPTADLDLCRRHSNTQDIA